MGDIIADLKTHTRTTSVNSESDVFSGETNIRPEGYRFELRDAKKSWVNVQSGDVWFEEYHPSAITVG